MLCIEEKINVYRILVGQHDVRVKEGNVKMDLREIGCKGMHWILLAKNRDSSCQYSLEPSGTIKMQGICYLAEELLPLNEPANLGTRGQHANH